MLVVGIIPATHRQPDDASAALPEGKRERQGAGNNPAPVTKPAKELLFFGKDFGVLNIGSVNGMEADSIRFLDNIFSFPHNDTNAAEILEMDWANTGLDVSVHFAFTKEGDELALIFQGKEKIFSIQKVGEDSELRTRLRYKYQYRISFYGVFFALDRIGKLDIDLYWKIFLDDITRGLVSHSISRLDLCVDITNIDPIEIARGVRGEESKMKEFSTMRGKMRNQNPETIMYGTKGDNNWFARIYKKLIEMSKKGKERLYLDYLVHDLITRLEVVLKSPILSDQYQLSLDRCLDVQFLFNIFCNQLETKYVSWDILPFIKREMKKKGYQRIKIEKYKKFHNPLPRDKKFKRIKSAVKKYHKDYDYDLKLLCERIYLSIEQDDD